MSKEKLILIKLAGDAKRCLTNARLAKCWILGGLTFLLMGSSILNAQTLDWVGTGTSSWFTRTNWNPSGPPGSAQNASVINGATAQIDAAGALAAILTIDGGSTVQVLTGGTLGSATPVTSITIGTTGRLEFSGGTVTVLAANGILDNGSIVFDGLVNHTQGITTTGTGNLILNGPGTSLVINSENTYSGGTIITAGTLQIGSGAAAGSITGNVVDNGILAFDRSDAVTFTGAISGSGGLNKLAAGTLTLSGVNTYGGATTISAGTLLAGSVNGLSPNSAFTVDLNTTLDLNGFNNTIGSLSGAGTVINGVKARASLTVGNNNTSTTFSGSLTADGVGILQLTKTGTGTLILAGANSYTGGTTITQGTLQIGDGGIAGSITGDVLDNGTLAFSRSDLVTFSGAITGTGGLAKLGTGTLILNGANTYAGTTTITGGTLVAGAAGSLGQNSAFTVNAVLDLNGFDLIMGSLSGTGTVLNNGAIPATLTVGTNNNDTTFGGALENGESSLQLTKTGAGTLTVAGANTYSGATIVNSGTLLAGSTNGFSPNSAFTVNSVLDLGGFNNTIGSLAGTGIVTNGGAALATLTVGNDGTNTIFDGALQDGLGVLQLTKLGAGTLTLTGNNSYSGETTVSEGIVVAGSNTAFSSKSAFTVNAVLDLNGFDNTIGSLSGTGTVLNNGATPATLTAGTDNRDTTFGGLLEDGSGILRFAKSGTGALTLTGTNTYTGGTTINAGTLQLGDGGIVGSITGDVTDNGVLAFNRSNSVTFGGVISGTGSVINLGSGTLTLTGENTYTGGTTINAGTAVQVGDGGTAGSIKGDVADNGTLTFNRSNDVSFDGVISGTGNLVKLGAGGLTLVKANTYTGTTTVNAGSLIVDGSIASQQTIVNPGAFLGGRGTIGGDLLNNGVVAQFNSPGTLTVVGNYTQNANGTLQIRVAGLNANQHDLVTVNGHANLAGTLQLVRVGGFSLKAGDQILFLTAKNGVSGTFDNTQNGFVATGTVVQGAIKPLADGIVLEGQQGSFANAPGVTTTGNGSAVAGALDRVAGDPREAALIGFLNSEPLAKIPHDLALIAPTQISSVSSVGVSTGKVQVSNVGQRMANIRGGSTGFSSSGFALSGGTPSFGEGFAGVTGPEGKSGPAVFAPTPDNRWGVFVTGLGEFTNVDGNANAGGYDVDTGGFTFGIDTRVTPNFVVGLTGGYAHTTVNLDGGGNIDVNGGKIGIYSTLFGNGFYLDAAASIGPSGYDMRRTALLGSANGNTDGTDINVLVAGGYDWKSGNFTVGPTANFQYSYVGLNSFTETGSLAPLKFPNQSTESERTAFGAKASYDWKIGQITVIPEISAAWQHEYGTTEYSVVAGFASGAGSNFTVKGPATGRDSLLIGAGATVIWNDRVSTYLAYDGEVLRTNYQSHNVTGGIRISF